MYIIRKNSLSVDGEYGKGNQIFKEIRNTGLLDELKDALTKSKSKILSLESYKNIEALGWLAIALVIFTLWRPHISIIGSILFGMLYLAGSYIPTMLGIELDLSATPFLKMLPYVVTILVLIITSVSKKRENQPPQGLGIPYFREDR